MIAHVIRRPGSFQRDDGDLGHEGHELWGGNVIASFVSYSLILLTWDPNVPMISPMHENAALDTASFSGSTSPMWTTHILFASFSGVLKSPTTFMNACKVSNKDLVSPRPYITVKHRATRFLSARPGSGNGSGARTTLINAFSRVDCFCLRFS